MPLRTGTSQKVISDNISEIMASFAKSGKIGTSRPKNKAKALQMAQAIALAKARQSGLNGQKRTATRIKKTSRQLKRM